MKNNKLFTTILNCLTVSLLLGSSQAAAFNVLIQAEDYTNFSDTTSANLGGQYRTDAVDIQVTSDTGGGYNVGWIESTEMLDYTLELSAGTYVLSTRVAARNTGDYTLSIDSQTIASDTVATNGWQTYQTHEIGEFTVSSGEHTITLSVNSGNFNINWLNLELIAEAILDSDNDGVLDDTDQCPNTPINTSVDTAGCAVVITSQVLIEAEDYTDFNDSSTGNTGGQYRSDDVDIQGTTDTNGGYNIGWTAAGEWLEYEVTLGAGTYNVSTRVASPSGGGSYELSIDGNVFTTDTVDSTGGWQNYTTNDNGQITVQAGTYTVRLNILNAGFNLNWLQLTLTDDTVDTDNDGINDSSDQCPNTPTGEAVNSLGCSVTNLSVTPLYNSATALEGVHQEHTSTALITRFGDRPRTRHAKENEFQSYDHYIAHYFERRSSSVEIIDHVAKGGEGITINVRTVWPISTQREGRVWYMGWGTKADYIDNSLMQIDTSRGDENGYDGSHFHYTKTVTFNPRKSPSNLATAGDTALGNFGYDSPPIAIGDLMEFEISQFSGTLNGEIIGGQTNYYGSTFLYIAGSGIVPWYLENPGEFVQYQTHFQEDSRELPEEYRLGGGTTAPYQYTDEPDNYFMQMALNIDYDKSQKFLEGRRVFHSSFIDGQHDEFVDNGTFTEVTNLIGAHYVNESCSSCHERNGGAAVEANGVPLDRWVFKIGDVSGEPDADRGRVIQPSNTSGSGEGTVAIAQWTELEDGLRTPTFTFENGQPALFSARISPRIVGLGLLEAIKEEDILALELAQQSTNDGVSGRANIITAPQNPAISRIGRFGWKASTVSVEHQVAAALNTDMGVKTSLLPDLDCGSNQTDCSSGAAALDDTNLDKLVYYVQALAVRAQRGLESGVENQSIKSGKQVFVDTGCAACHTPSFQTSEYHPLVEVRDQAIQPYTDMLIHDMGDGLADNLGEGLASGREWRTTPLWGLGLSMCVTNGVINPTGAEGDDVCNEAPGGTYLHDGRARTIREAILWHGTNGSEALSATNNYKELSANDLSNLHNFLEAL
ncbi:di-heme oxidoredictase family protein [Colwellia echini]|uniref:Carbohydrate-binding protein n=1 Tax=Colwellia echini TaxID=1982103 RepID=A0ABY3MY45_9GAMM|nr:di-heme oxidoredictase family protein [Colwellia echini]TYK66109.1 carbohydrate-binding protein [Colwellia echini]